MTVVDALGGWAMGEGPLYRRLAEGVRGAIERGDLRPGEVLPAERTLARTLAVSRTTVVTAYDLLRQDGLVESRQGSGTRVLGGTAGMAPGVATDEAGDLLGGAMAVKESVTLFTRAALGGAPVVADAITGLDPEEVARQVAEAGYEALGIPELRQAVAEHLAGEGVPTNPEEILITNGGQQAISLLAQMYLRPREAVVVEDPTYIGAVDAIRSTGARMIPVPVHKDGADLESLGEALGRTPPALVYLVPTFQAPTGTVMPEAAGRAVARLAKETGVPVIDDRVVAEIRLDDDPLPPPLAAHDPDAPIITVGSASKLFWGGLRVGWIRAAAPLIDRLARRKVGLDLGSSIVSQMVAAKLVPTIAAARAERGELVRRRCERLTALLRESLPDWTWDPPRGGLSLWVRIPEGDADEFANVAQRHQVAVLSGPMMSPAGGHRDQLRIPYVHEAAEMEEGVRRLAAAWAAYRQLARPREATAPVLV